MSIIFERPWLGEAPEDWKKANATSVFEKGKKEDWWNYRPISFISNTAEVMEQLILEMIFKQMRDTKVIVSSHHAFTNA